MNPAFYAARTAVNIFVAEFRGPNGAIMRPGAFGESTVKNQYAVLVGPQQLDKLGFFILTHLFQLRYGKFKLNCSGVMSLSDITGKVSGKI